ncbi:MAG: hypothetical protein RL660_2004 [Bacteroidota bacterium]
MLYINSAFSNLEVSIISNGTLVYNAVSTEANNHSTAMVALVDECLDKCGLASLSELDAFAILSGPGSYTGLRIGMSYVKGLAAATQKPIIAIDLFDILLYNSKSHFAFYQPMKGEVLYKVRNETTVTLCTTSEAMAMVSHEKPAVVLSNSIHDLENAQHIVSDEMPNIATCVWQRFTTESFSNLLDAAPFYGKDVFIAKPKAVKT